MTHRIWTHQTIEAQSTLERLHLMNSITGIKPANLIATEDKNQNCNLAIFSSIVHLGSKPPLLGFILRPCLDGNRHTYENIKATGRYTINSVDTQWVDKAHYSSARFAPEVCEFDEVGLTPQRYLGFDGIFVKESAIQIGLELVEEIPIEANQTRMLIGEVKFIAIKDENQTISSDLQLNLEQLNLAGISGLNRYYQLQQIAQFQEAEVGSFPQNKIR